MALSHLHQVTATTSWTILFPIAGCLFSFINLLLCLIAIPVFNANSVDPYQKLHSVASDLGLHGLPITLFWGVSRLKWIKYLGS